VVEFWPARDGRISLRAGQHCSASYHGGLASSSGLLVRLASASTGSLPDPVGVLIGLFVEFIFRVSDDVPYDQLRAINPGRWKPFQRAFNTVLVAYIFAAILAVGAFQVGVASVLLNDFIDKKPELSLAIGFVTGFAFPFVRDLVQQFRPTRRDGAARSVFG
jgi:hypothetical protein